MRKTILYVAMSLDGYIADSNGGVDWLQGDGSQPESKGTYEAFINTVKYVIMGYQTYHQIKTELSPTNWPYSGKQCHVLTHRSHPDDPDVLFESDLCSLIETLREKNDGDLWICGGSEVVNQLMKVNRIDEMRLAMIPTTLGQGIALFQRGIPMQEWSHVSTVTYNGIVELAYRKRSVTVK